MATLLGMSTVVAAGPRKPAGIAGVLGVACATLGGVVIAPIWSFPGTGSSDVQIVTFVASHRTGLLFGMFLITVGVTLWLVFAAGVFSVMSDRTGGGNLLATCFAFGMAAVVTLLLAGFVALFLLIYRGGPVRDARFLYDLTFGLLAMSGAPTAVALSAYAVFVIKTGELPRVTERLAVVAAVAHVVLLASFIPRSGFFSLEGQVITAIPATLFVWIAVTAVAMLRSDAPTHTQPAKARG